MYYIQATTSTRKTFFEVEKFSLERKPLFNKRTEIKPINLDAARLEVENIHPRTVSKVFT